MGGEFLTGLSGEKISLNIFLIYFAAISLAIFFVANKMFLKGVGLLNSVGLFLGTISLVLVRDGSFEENIYFSISFAIIVLLFHIAAMAVNAKKFEKESDPFLVSGYLLPLV
jgi:hypothetical protein